MSPNIPSDNRALTLLDISDNGLCAKGTKLLAEALKSNQIMTALNISFNNMMFDGDNDFGDMSGVAALVDAMPGMGAISQFTFSGDGDGNTPVTMEISMTEADFSAKALGTSGAIMVAAFLPKCDNRAMTSLNLASNKLGVEGAKIIAACIPTCT
jgi:Ran GTPase-activating protein (RanGAP) involved in mRNA processing and transport